MYQFLVENVEQTIELGRTIGEHISPGAVVGLQGPLGAGKTELVRGMAQGLGIAEDISSPTFVLEVVYEIPSRPGQGPVLSFHHWDLYRITSGEIDCEIFDYAGDIRRVTAVEWPERVSAIQDLLAVHILLDFCDLNGSTVISDESSFAGDCGKRRISIDLRRDLGLSSALSSAGVRLIAKSNR